jgi:hypothetical protein
MVIPLFIGLINNVIDLIDIKLDIAGIKPTIQALDFID